jgi:hypothetical protein
MKLGAGTEGRSYSSLIQFLVGQGSNLQDVGCKKTVCILGLRFDPEDEGNTFLRNVG